MSGVGGFFYGDMFRELLAAGLVVAYAGYCWHKFRQSRQARQALPSAGAAPVFADASQVWVIYASQSGQAEDIARQTAASLATPRCQTHVCRIDEGWQEKIVGARCVLFVASTYGEGGAPDHAARFVREYLGGEKIIPALRGVRFGVLALGDSSYQSFCAFGRQIDAWLQASGAVREFPRIDVDRLEGKALRNWQKQLSVLGLETRAEVSLAQPQYAEWEFVERQCLNPGSPGSPICLVVLRLAGGGTHTWQAGDLVDVLVPQGDGHPRAYSIANLPGEGRIELIVRRHVREDGTLGLASGWLTERALPGDRLSLRIRNNPGFHMQQDLRKPLILIGSGAGIAGLRAHLQARARMLAEAGEKAPQRDAWLFFGERSGRHDHLCQLEIEAWKRSGVLSRVNIAFSRDDPVTPYVQHSLLAQGKEVCDWIAAGAQILICGNARKMAVGVDEALRKLLGAEQVDSLCEAGRIRRDVF